MDEDAFWREGELLVVRKGAVLPDRCIATGVPTGANAVSRKVRFIPEWSVALLVLISPLFGLIGMVIASRTGPLTYFIDRAAQQRRRVAVRAAIGLFATTAVVFGLGLVFEVDALFAVAFVALVLGLIAADAVARPFRVHRIKGDRIYLRVRPAFWSDAESRRPRT